MSTDILMTKAGPGAGDMLTALNCAYGWAAHYDVNVELEYHWSEPKDFFYHSADPEKLGERIQTMSRYMKSVSPNTVEVINVWNSDLFDYHGAQGDYLERYKLNPIRWILPPDKVNDSLHFTGKQKRNNTPFGSFYGMAEWDWEEPAIEDKKKIVYWDYSQNREEPQEMKITNSFSSLFAKTELQKIAFPDYELVELTYRDSFEHAYNHIRDCSFCIGYDGMWHMIARNFGKLFICATGNPQHTQRHTNPGSAAFFNEYMFFGYIYKVAENREFLEKEINYAKMFHQRRMEWYGKVEG